MARDEATVRPARGRPAVPAPLVALAAIAIFQTSAASAKTLFDNASPEAVVFLRLAFASFALAAVNWRGVRSRSLSDLPLVAALGIAMAGMNLMFYASLNRLPLGIAVTLEFVGPLGVALLGSRRALDLLWVVAAGGGVALLAQAGGPHVQAAGVAFALGAGACWGAYILLTKRLGRAFSDRSGIALAMGVAGLVAAPFGIATAGSAVLDPTVIAATVALATLGTALPFSLEFEVLRRIPTHVFGVLMSLEPAMAALAGLAVLGERLSARDVAAIALVVAASIGSARSAVAVPEPRG